MSTLKTISIQHLNGASPNIYLANNGSVGIGASPGNSLDIENNLTSQIRVGYTPAQANAYYDFGRDSADGLFGFNGGQNSPFVGYKWKVNGTEYMRIDSSGYVTKPYHPYLRAIANTSVQSLTSGVTVVVAYNNIVEQTGSNYNNSTYRFTCPVAGKYMVTAAVQGQTLGASWYNLKIRRNGSAYFGTYMTGLNVGYQPLYTYGIMICNVSDYIDVVVDSNITQGQLELNTNEHRNTLCIYFLG